MYLKTLDYHGTMESVLMLETSVMPIGYISIYTINYMSINPYHLQVNNKLGQQIRYLHGI